MKRTIYLVLVFAVVFLTNCKSDSNKNETTGSQEKVESVQAEQQKTFKITKVGAEIYGDNYEINEVFKKSPYGIKNEEVTEMQEGTEVVFNTTRILKNGQEIAILYDDEKMLLSDDFKTETGIGVGSTIKEFVAAYPDYKIWYTYVSNSYIIETPLLPDAQFILDPLSFIGDENVLNESDMVVLTIAQMEQGGKITKVRMFEMIGC